MKLIMIGCLKEVGDGCALAALREKQAASDITMVEHHHHGYSSCKSSPISSEPRPCRSKTGNDRFTLVHSRLVCVFICD